MLNKQTNYVQLYQSGGGFFSSLFGGIGNLFKKRGSAQDANNQFQLDQQRALNSKINTKNLSYTDPNSTAASSNPTNGFSAKQTMAGLNGIAQGFGAISNAQDIEGTEKAGVMADGITGAVSTGLGAFGPTGSLIGAGLSLINGIGGSLLNNNKTAKMAKDFTINDTVKNSSSYGGVTSGALDAQKGGQGYRSAGLFGKLFSNTGKIQDNIKGSETMQSFTGDLLKKNKLAIDSGAASQDLFAARSLNNLYGNSAWTNGSVQYGQSGMKIKSYPKDWMAKYVDSPMYRKRLDNFGIEDKPDSKRILNAHITNRIGEGSTNSNDAGSNEAIERHPALSKDIKPNVDNINIDRSQIKGMDKADDVLAHELAHTSRNVSDREQLYIANKNQNVFNRVTLSQYGKGVKGYKNYAEYMSKSLEGTSGDIEVHDSDPDENRADINGLRYMMFKKGIYDTSKRDMTQEDLRKALNDKEIQSSHMVERLFSHFTADDIIDLNNKVATNKPTSSIPMVQYGESGLKFRRRLPNGGTRAVLNYQKMMNQRYGANIAEDGLWGRKTEAAFEKFEPAKYKSVIAAKGKVTEDDVESISGGEIPEENRIKPEQFHKFNPILGGGEIKDLPREQPVQQFNPVIGGRIPDDNVPATIPTKPADTFNPVLGGGEIKESVVSNPSSPPKVQNKVPLSQSKFQQFTDIALANLQSLFPNRKVDLKYQSDGIYNKDGGRDIRNQDTLKKKGSSQTAVSLHNFNAARDYTIYVDGKPINDSTIYKKVLWDAADKTQIYHLKDWDPGHIGLAKEGAGTAFDEIRFKYPELLQNDNAQHTIDYLKAHPERQDYRVALDAINNTSPYPMRKANPFHDNTDPKLSDFTNESMIFKRQHGGRVGIPQLPKPGIPSTQGALQGAAAPPKLPIGNHAMGMGVQAFEEPKQVVENKGDKGVDIKQQTLVTNQLKDANRLGQPKPAVQFSPDIMQLVTSAIDRFDPATYGNKPVAAFKEGGAINVIVDGSLHAHKHDIEVDGNITGKGVPVVTMSEGGEVEQHAEVERDELILHYDLTKKLEQLMEEGTDEAAIEAGRILSKEIVRNTKDSKSKILQTA